tara:strand:+ start:38 stop:739 length:702 start_codon:yes stop_codon:yes gene_type:complete
MSNTLPDEIQQQLHREISKEVQLNVNTQVAPELIPFHALPIYKESTDLRLNKEEMEIILGGEFLKALSTGGNAISRSAEILENEKLERVKTFILSKFHNYVTQHLQIQNQFYLTQSWVAVNGKGASHHSHIHPNTVFSCVYYVQAESGDFQIKMPLSRIQEGYGFSYKILQSNIFNSRTYNAKVKTGDIVIFPGWCEHKALPNEHEAPRIILGTNYFVTGTLGDYNNKDEIKI